MINLWGLDQAAFRLVNDRSYAPWLDALARGLSYPPLPALWFAGLAAIVIALRRRAGVQAVILIGIAVGLTDAIAGSILKPFFDRLRPCFALPDVRLLVPGQAHSPSFPSNHAANMFAAAAVIGVLGRRFALVAYGLASLVALTRVLLGVHYPLDVLAGAILGLGIGLAVRGFPRALSAARSRPEPELPKPKA